MDEVRALPGHFPDTQVLARTIASTDSLVRRLREQQEENTRLKIVLATVKKTASKFHKLYEKEKETGVKNEEALRVAGRELEESRRRAEALDHELVNMDCVHRQTIEVVRKSAETEAKNRERVWIELVREYFSNVQTLTDRCLMDDREMVAVTSMRNKLEAFECLKEVLGEFQEKKKRKGRKKSLEEADLLEAKVLEENLMSFESPRKSELSEEENLMSFESLESLGEAEILPEVKLPEPEKTFCDRGTMTTSVTVTRGTNTVKLKSLDVGTSFPEVDYPSSYEEIFSEMIFELPELLPELPNAIQRDSWTETDPAPSMRSAETLTDLCNIRKVIGYRKRKAICQPERVKVEDLKIEPPSPRPDENPPVLNPQFDRLWSIMGQTLFALLRNSPNDFAQSQYLLEQENIVKQIFMEEMMKRETQFFLPGHPVSVQVGASEPPEVPMKEVEVPEVIRRPQRERIRWKVPRKRKRSNRILKSGKKIKLQRKLEEVREEIPPEVEEEDPEEFDLEKIREFFALPDLLEPIEDLPEDFLPELEVNCDREEIEEPPETIEAPPRALTASIMNFVHRQTPRVINKFPDPGDLERCRRILTDYLVVEWISEELARFVNRMTDLQPQEVVIFQVVAEVVENSPDQLVFNPFGCLAPLIPKTHQQILIFCHRVGQRYPEGFLRRLQNFLERRIFTLSVEQRTLKNLINLTFLLIPLMDLQFEERFGRLPVRLFIFKCLYYFHHKAPPLIYLALKAFPDALPVAEGSEKEEFREMESLLLALRCSLAHLPALSSAETERPEFKKKELLQLLTSKYKYTPGAPSIEETTLILLDRMKTGNCDRISHAFTLLSKRMGFKWGKSLVRNHLIGFLNDLLLQPAQEARDSQIVSLLSSISCIVKAFPNNEDISEFYRIFGCVLETVDSHRVEEAAIGAFIRLSRFGMVNVFSQIYQWRARRPISRQLGAALDTFVHRKVKKFWLQLESQIN